MGLPATIADALGGLDRPDRRQYRRVPWEHYDLTAASFEVEGPDRRWRPVPCTIVDLGEGGLGMLAAEPLEPGARVRLTFTLPSRIGRDAEPAEGRTPQLIPWAAVGEVVHAHRAPIQVPEHVPPAVRRPHHHG
ncbi:MAG: PilZ domain-containing protein, partial [Chloroflexota bacterium]